MKWIEILLIVCMCSCSTSKRITTQERITSTIEYIPTTKRVAIPNIKGNYKIINQIGIDTIINSKNLNIRLQIQDSIIMIQSELKDSIDVLSYDKVITNDTVRESIKKKRGNTSIMLLFFLFLLFILVFRFR